MAHLAQNQFEFQQYNQQLKGPSSPVDMNTLKKKAEMEQLHQAAMGKVFDKETSTYVETDDTPQPLPEEKPETNTKKRSSDRALKNPFKKTRYEVYTNTPIADKFGVKMTRVIEMGTESWGSASEARDAADRLRAKGMEAFVFRVNRAPLKNRKVIKTGEKKQRVRKPKTVLKCVKDYDNVDFGDWKGLPGTLGAKGKQMTWWIPKNVPLNPNTDNETIRNCVLSMKRIQASVVTEWLEAKKNQGEPLRLSQFLVEVPYWVNAETEKSKLRQLTMRLRRICGRFSHKAYLSQMVISSDMLPSAPVAGAASHANESTQPGHTPPTTLA